MGAFFLLAVFGLAIVIGIRNGKGPLCVLCSGLSLKDLWSWQGTVSRKKYCHIGVLLFALKYNIDRFIVLRFFQKYFTVLDYYKTLGGIEITEEKLPIIYTLVLWSIPFLWTGVVLTIRRLRDCQLPLPLLAFFFLPFVNLLFFAILCLLPSKGSETNTESVNFLNALIPRSQFGSAAMALAITLGLALPIGILSVSFLKGYSAGLFLGLPFLMGLLASVLNGFHEKQSLASCIGISWTATLLLACLLFFLAIEGLICIIMALPIGGGLAALGAVLGYALQAQKNPAPVLQCFAGILPLLLIVDSFSPSAVDVAPVHTSVLIKAPPKRVWKHVVSFSTLPPPQDPLFLLGIAYPIHAEISGHGEGAIRKCVFSTGAFIEPITTWDEPRLLQFSVIGQPPPMSELSIYRNVAAAHIEGYFGSKRGQFLLKEQADGSTLLEGTTWYAHRVWPQWYWRLWSDFIVHRIHTRVLNHIKQLAEPQIT